jgi:peptidoglycan hydrolase CwlO-like protein
MDAELAALEAKVQQAASQLRLLREESRELRQQVAARTDENARLTEKLAAAKARIEALLRQIPETEA